MLFGALEEGGTSAGEPMEREGENSEFCFSTRPDEVGGDVVLVVWVVGLEGVLRVHVDGWR